MALLHLNLSQQQMPVRLPGESGMPCCHGNSRPRFGMLHPQGAALAVPCRAAGGIFLDEPKKNPINGRETAPLVLRFSSRKHTCGPLKWLLADKEARPWLSALWLTRGNMVSNGLSQQRGPSPTPAPKLPLLLFDAASLGSACVDPGN